MAITIAFQLWCMQQGEEGERRAGKLQQQRMPVQLGSACVCVFLFLVHFPLFLQFLFMQVAARIFNFMSLPFGRPGDGRGGGSQIRLRISCRLQLQPNCQLDSPNFSLEFALFAVPHKSVQYFLYEPPLSLFLLPSPLFLTFFQLHLLCRYLS